MPDSSLKKCIKVGQSVEIIRRSVSDSRITGCVEEIIDENDHNPDGIKVVLDNGFSGNVVNIDILWPDNLELKKMIENHENSTFELKTTFRYDIINDIKKSKDLQTKLAQEVIAFLNMGDIGYICLGVDDRGRIVGLEAECRDIQKSIMKKRKLLENEVSIEMIRDQFGLKISESITSEIDVQICPFEIKFYNLMGKEICLLRMQNKEKRPYYTYDPDKKTREFYVRDGTSTRHLDVPNAIRHMQEHNFKIT